MVLPKELVLCGFRIHCRKSISLVAVGYCWIRVSVRFQKRNLASGLNVREPYRRCSQFPTSHVMCSPFLSQRHELNGKRTDGLLDFRAVRAFTSGSENTLMGSRNFDYVRREANSTRTVVEFDADSTFLLATIIMLTED